MCRWLNEERVRIDRLSRPIVFDDDGRMVMVCVHRPPGGTGWVAHDESGGVDPRKLARREDGGMLTNILGLCRKGTRDQHGSEGSEESRRDSHNRLLGFGPAAASGQFNRNEKASEPVEENVVRGDDLIKERARGALLRLEEQSAVDRGLGRYSRRHLPALPSAVLVLMRRGAGVQHQATIRK